MIKSVILNPKLRQKISKDTLNRECVMMPDQQTDFDVVEESLRNQKEREF